MVCASVSIYLRWWVISTYMEGILYKILSAENCQNVKMATVGRNMEIFLANKHHHLAIFYRCVFD